MIHYIIQTVAFQVFFLLVYDVFLKKETFFNWNRFYLITTAVLSLILPFIQIESFSDIVPQNYIIALPEVVLGQGQSNVLTQDASQTFLSNSLSFLEIAFYLGVGVSAILFVSKLSKVAKLIRVNPKEFRKHLVLVNLLNSSASFSFFKYVFLGENIANSEKETILKHELIHVKHKHSADLVGFEILRILFWFNPLIYMYQNRITEVHEFIADAEVVKNENKSAYYQNLLAQVFDTQKISFINPFFKQSLIKKRIIMLQKSKSKQTQLFKYALIIPLVLGMLVYTSCKTKKHVTEAHSDTEKKENIIVREDQVDEDIAVPFGVVEHVPVFPGCEELETKAERKACFSKSVTTHVAKNFNTKIADSLGLKGQQRINVIFKINKKGEIEDVRSRSPQPELAAEAIRVINTLPKMTPGMQKNKLVTVPYSLPIVF
ncbi:M56 family metallopeptidase [Algibacter miyuki]|uniref:M56 family metallopeptidase n=1 Tax=Algibacter miyuki TaxID=1306933 RepID=A0ABV5GWT1_9FLAO|nr:M56 family metallopeptidase [Algibacter miyuki]MDN3664576.1 M56 family metallopeptidase [Algibacter miyuki]